MMRTQDEIVARIKQQKAADFLGFETDEYYPYLDFQHVKDFMKDSLTEKEWQDVWSESTKTIMVERMTKYMPFAIEKAENERGISANRSIMHYIAWIWLACDDDLLSEVEKEYDTNYHSYGLPILRTIAAHYKMDA